MDVVVSKKGEGRKEELNGIRLVHKLDMGTLEGILVEIEPGRGVPEAFSHPGLEVRIVLQGEIEVCIRDRCYILREGDVMGFDSTTPHTIRNTGQEKAVFFVLSTSG